jgi:hypothetical protein
MYSLAKVIDYLFPLIALILLIIGLRRNAIYYVISSLWLSLIALLIHFQSSGGEILGSYFNYFNASIYSINLIILFIAFFRVVAHLRTENVSLKYLITFIQSLVVIGGLFVFINLWINAYFIENRMPGTPVIQVALLEKSEQCSYRYIFYKVASDRSIVYLCPNYYGLIPSIGRLALDQDFIRAHLSTINKKQMLLLQPKN